MYPFRKKKLDDNLVEQSILWHIVKNFYIQQGPDAWNDQVPFTITNLRSIAHAHAKRILSQTSSQDNICIVDYGAGIGQHGFFLATELQALRPNRKFKLILADISERTLSYWRNHPQLSVLIDQGLVIPHLLSGDIEQDTTQVKQQYQPHAYIFNYLIDSLPLQAVSHNYMQNLRLYTNEKHLQNGAFNGNLRQLDMQFHCSGQQPNLKYQIDKKHYTIPTKGIELLNAIFEDSHCQIAIINDKGALTLDDIADDGDFSIDLEGCFSSRLNFHLLLSALPTDLNIARYGHQTSPIKSCVISKNEIDDHDLLCPETSSLIQSIKNTPLESNDHALAICRILHHDRFCLELLSQSPHLVASPSLDACINRCLSNAFTKQLDFAHLHTARIYRTTTEKDKSLKHLNAFREIYPEHPALMLEYGIHYLNDHPKLSIQHLQKAAEDPKLHPVAQRLLEKVSENC
jgi:hypothetical protein